MNRVIIHEIDNTSNFEGLSSYDVVYVPGFGNGGDEYFREPTLFTNKYTFSNAIGGIAPRFEAPQYYNKDEWDADAFPDDFNMGFDPIVPFEKYMTTSGTGIDWHPTEAGVVPPVISVDGSEARYNCLNDAMTELDPGTEMKEGDQWFRAKEGTDNIIECIEYVAGYKVENPKTIYSINPRTKGLYVLNAEGEHIHANDVLEEVDYFEANTDNKTTMIPSGTSDYGYRYASLLLSMGIPVYYEQMNSTGLEEVVATDENLDELTVDLAYGKLWLLNPIYDPDVKNENQYILPTTETAQLGVTYYRGTPVQLDAFYAGLQARFTEVEDPDDPNPKSPATGLEIDNMGDYTIKFFTTGGYPMFERTGDLSKAMIEACAKRGDAITLVDHTNYPDRPITISNTKSVANKVRSQWQLSQVEGSYAAMFTPWYEVDNPIVADGYGYDNAMPASLAYLTTLARQIREYNPWLAVSGVNRGIVPYLKKLHINRNLTNNIADSYQQVPTDIDETNGKALISINPITNIRNVGYCIWGNRTLRNNGGGTKATSFLSTRNQVSDIKKCIYETSQKLLFEQNSDVLWVNWRSYVTPMLDSMVSNNIIRDYNIVRFTIDPETGERVPAYKVLARITITPINAIEQFELTVNLVNEDEGIIELQEIEYTS